MNYMSMYPLEHIRVCIITSTVASGMTTPVEKQPQIKDAVKVIMSDSEEM